jgi:MerR family transcriptional regulator, thiopeptide resistance regulator
MNLLTVGQMARGAKISRTSLLYYERMGLLRPSGRSSSGYRLYGQAEVERLRALRIYRDAGVPISEIRQLLSSDHNESATVLERRMVEIDRQVRHLRTQQRLLARLMAHPATMTLGGLRTKARWVSSLRAAGFTEHDMDEWHCAFEADAPEAHQQFLAALGMSDREISRVRVWSTSRSAGTV